MGNCIKLKKKYIKKYTKVIVIMILFFNFTYIENLQTNNMLKQDINRHSSTRLIFCNSSLIEKNIDKLFLENKDFEVRCKAVKAIPILFIGTVIKYNYYESKEQFLQVQSYINETSKMFRGIPSELQIIDVAKFISAQSTYGVSIHASPYSPYSIVKYNTGVCQAYAVLYYMFMKNLDIQSKVITGELYGKPHAWNLVKINNVWYNVDITSYINEKDSRYILFGGRFLQDKYRNYPIIQEMSYESF